MFHKILIANRGEIAVRIIRACREMGIRTVAVCSEADRLALHAQIADECVCIGPAPSRDSYLNMQAILSACEITGAEAVHPGFGFLSENSAFARLCERCNVKFIGPSPESIDRMGDKANAKTTMRLAGVPVVPGSDGAITSMAEARRIAREVGYPVMVKASAGGGGRGIRRVDNEDALEAAVTAAQQEAQSCFGDDTVYLEKFIVDPRHVEIQILADEHGHVVHLGERDCSLQRRNQKMIEESPSPSPLMNDALRAKMGEAAVSAARAVDYHNAGTIEFLLDTRGDFYFMEMNTRVQVEHPVTEFVTGLDIVQQQIRIAAGEPLDLRQEDIHLTGHAIECRINAENPALGFRPSPGTVTALHMPGGPGIRVDSAMYAGYTIPPYYDSMIAKLIAYAPTREQALAKMKWALAEFLVEGVDTNVEFQLELLRDPDVERGRYDIGFLTRRMEGK
ncbi:acetyl-CoA carboxylase biotin carboxylase subunit [Clostridiaceae bacterium NSJ-31]|uniref:Biotin carboxylase n=1 Tax=Ligaoa zhengdingensis TaxID=2763658 RepID=A0A926HZR1_9FIRM|nr:acetyl-CoA carboxylase biotin carboxylase subunit [Ligaoa zhengdingensis]MBC8546197.1 acetyl-CoA carboxylase biotin carboxylase subunit [Ligaoa zhengdingensis]